MSPARQPFLQTASAGVSRRRVVSQALAAGVGAALAAGGVPDAAATQDATPVLGLAASTIETVSAQAVRRDASDGPLVGRMYMEEQFGVSDPALPDPGPLARQLPLSGVS